MYLKHFQLNTKPFQITADPKFLWLGEKHKEALATLRYGIVDNRGFLLLTGEVGTGKTILINRLVSMLDLDTVVATLPDPDLVSMDFYNLLADGFKMNRTFESKGAFLIHLRDFLHQSHANRKQVLLVIDESQRLNHHLMEDIRVLSNIELHDRKLINIFFVGQQEFNTILSAPQNRALAQRITVRYNISPLDKEEVGKYITHRLKVAGSTQGLFTPAAIDEVFQFSGGIPRLINILCDHALLTGYARGAKEVDDRIVKECAEELRIPVKSASGRGPETGQAQDSKSIANAAAKKSSEASGKPVPSQAAGDKRPENQKMEAESGSRSPAWKVLYAGIVLLLVALGAYAINNYTGHESARYNADDLTPQKYKTSLEQEKETLAKRMEKGGTDAENEAALSQMDQKKLDKQVSGDQGARQESTAGQGVGSSSSAAAKDQKIGAIAPLPLIKDKATVYFTLNSNEIDPKSYATLDGIAAYLNDHPDQVVYVRGYTDSIGSSTYNESVSRFRASAVKSYLMGKGAPTGSL
ncbi:MAG: AAA family ATPase, partial [Desulfatitalea sp.]|nr:AAA family ATPase [Desulfatitalea sp.]